MTARIGPPTDQEQPDEPTTEHVSDPADVARAIERGERPVVADHYQIEQTAPIGSGGMALVFAGRDLRTRRPVALKTLKPEWIENPAARSRFRHEARTMAFLAHPNVARVFDLYEPDDIAQPWVILELLEGPSLRQELDRNGPMDIDRIAHLLKQIAAALDHLHSRGLCHLDVKPQNILFADAMTVKLIDFGIAQPTGSAPKSGDQAFGSVTYLSPEQAAGERIGPASDTYSLGCVVYEMVTGTPPFVYPVGTDPQVVLAAHLTEVIQPPSERRPDLKLPVWIDDIVLDALERDPARRYPKAAAFADAFRSSMEAEIPPDSTVPLNHLPRFDPRRNPSVAYAEPSRVMASRRSPPLVARISTGWIWKLVGIMIVANLFLGLLTLAVNGRIPGIYDPATRIESGIRLKVTADVLNVRSSPDANADVLTELAQGAIVRATGLPRNGWIPVKITIDDQQTTGYVSIDHVESLPRSGIDRIRIRIKQVLP